MKKCGNKPENIIKYNNETKQYTNMCWHMQTIWGKIFPNHWWWFKGQGSNYGELLFYICHTFILFQHFTMIKCN